MKIEGVQRRATRFIVRSDMDYKGRLVCCSSLPLSLRREMLDITFLFKCRQGLHALDPYDFANEFHLMRRTRRSNKELIYSLPLCKTEIFANWSSLLSIPQTDISLFIQLLRRTVYFRPQIYFNETKILNNRRCKELNLDRWLHLAVSDIH